MVMSDLEVLKNVFSDCNVYYYVDGCCEHPLDGKTVIELGTEVGKHYFYFDRDNEEFIGCYDRNRKAFYPKNNICSFFFESKLLQKISSEFFKIGLQHSLLIRSDNRDSDMPNFEVLSLPSGLEFCDRLELPQETNDIVGRVVGVVDIKT